MNIERPLDLLDALKGQEVIIRTINEPKEIKAVLLAFDIHINLVISEVKKKMKFIRGADVISVGEA
jgi:small nuclear ribonucleoprotein (snRNP)-like protein